MLIYLARRLAIAAVTCLVISLATFLIIRLPPGDFVDSYIANLASSGSAVTLEQAQALRHDLGLDRPMIVQYGLWMSHVAEGNFGVSMLFKRPVTEVIGDRLWLTMAVSFAALFLTWALALPIGIYSAVRQYSWGDYLATTLGFIGLAVPNFLLALILMWLGLPLSRPQRGRPVLVGIRAGPVEPRAGLGPRQAPAASGLRARGRRDRAAHPHHARQFARRVAPALRRHRPREGVERGPGGAEIPGARGA